MLIANIEAKKDGKELSDVDVVQILQKTIKELAEETLRQLPKSKSKIVYRPLPSDDPKRRKPDIMLAKELLGWEPKVSLKDGLAKTIEYFRGR